MTFLDAADRIGARLCRDAFWHGGRCTWIGESLSGEWLPLGPDLYSGTAGIALFLNYLANATGESIFKDTAAGAIAHAISGADGIEPASRAGFYAGWGGITYAAAKMGRPEEAANLARRMELTDEFDLLYGSAGAIVALLALEFTDAAVRHGDHLIVHAERTPTGASWRTMVGSDPEPLRNLTGFSHGTAGIGWALLELFAATRETRFREIAEEAFHYERACYSAEQRNWPDYRGGSVAHAISWCHGAPGIGFSRLRAFQILQEAAYCDEAAAAIATTSAILEGPPDNDFCLCHGAAGNADLLLYAAQIAGGEASVPGAIMRAGIARYEARRRPWPCGLEGAGELPGLMLGIAGIGYFCLRLTDPLRYPSILLPMPAP